MIGLLDVNVLVALAWPHHIHHPAALQWFRENQDLGWATCPLTQSGFVRVSSNRKIISEARRPPEAIQLLRRILALPHHVFLPDSISIADSEWVRSEQILGHRQVTDAHLLAIALSHDGRLVTFDEGVRALLSTKRPEGNAVAVIHSGR